MPRKPSATKSSTTILPRYYQTSSKRFPGLEAVDVVETFNLSTHMSTAVIYLLRMGKKQGAAPVQEMEKAIWWIARGMAQHVSHVAVANYLDRLAGYFRTLEK